MAKQVIPPNHVHSQSGRVLVVVAAVLAGLVILLGFFFAGGVYGREQQALIRLVEPPNANVDVTGSIHGLKWNDQDGDGLKDPEESGLSNWEISLTDGEIIRTEVTDELGQYWFTDLLDGTYTVTEILQDGWTQTFPSGDGSHSVSTVGGQIVEDVNFGNQMSGAIHGLKWNDLDGDGFFDLNESGLPGWTIILEGEDGLHRETTTDEEGAYWLMDLSPGAYTVTEELQEGWQQSWPPDGFYSFLLGSGEQIDGLNFGNWQPLPGEIHGLKWNDLNGNGFFDLNESGLPGWTIILEGGNGLHRETITDQEGTYWFMDLPPGTYTVTEELKAGWQQSWPPDGFYSFLLGPGQQIDGLNFGNWLPPAGQIHGLKWNDLNGDGTKDPAESGLSGWTIILEGADGLNRKTTTDEQGTYWFMDLPPDTYTVTEELKAGWQQSWPPDAFYSFLLGPGQQIDGLNFGNWQPQPGEIHGLKWNDLNGNGITDSDEAGLSSWTIILVGESGLHRETTTDEEGSYWFLDLPPDTYTVTEELKTGWLQTWPPGTYYNFQLGPGQQVDGLNFGNLRPPPGEIHGLKWNDLDGDGTKDPDEPGMSGWTISLTDDSGKSWTTITNEKGVYWFMDLLPGTYTVREIEVSGWQQTAPLVGYYTIILVSGQIVENVDFGNWRPLSGDIHGLKWHDLDGDGIKDPVEPGLPGWTILLADDSGKSWTTITNEQGVYWFMDLLPGDYTVSEVEVPGWRQTAPPAGVFTFTLVSSQTVEGLDFGNWRPPPGDIHGLKWHDLNGDGTRDPGEPGLPGWTIILADESGNSWTTVTNEQGVYWFMDLLPGDYTVSEVEVPGWRQTAPLSGVFTFTLVSSQTVEGLDFGNWRPPPGDIHGLKWHDLNGDGTRDPGEPGLPGWTILLADVSGNSWTTLTDDQGFYWFMDLLPGDYTVSEVEVSGWKQTAPLSGVFTVTLASSQIVEGLDFGNWRPPPGEIHGLKWHDLDGDGERGPNELGLPGWTIFLSDDSGNSWATVTNEQGFYWFMELLPGTYKVREIEVIDWQQTWPTEGEYTVTLASSQKVEDLDFGNREMSDNRIFLPLLIKND